MVGRYSSGDWFVVGIAAWGWRHRHRYCGHKTGLRGWILSTINIIIAYLSWLFICFLLVVVADKLKKKKSLRVLHNMPGVCRARGIQTVYAANVM